MRLSYFCLVSFGKTIFVLWLFIRRIPPYVTVVRYLYLVKGGYYLGLVVFLAKGVGFELSEKLMKELVDLSYRLGRPKKKP